MIYPLAPLERAGRVGSPLKRIPSEHSAICKSRVTPLRLGRRMWAMKASCRRVSVLAISLCALMCLPARSGSGVTAPTAGPGAVQASSTAAGAPASVATTPIPGPLRSFLRMAGISQKVSPDEVLPLLSREVAVKGYQTVTVKSGKAPSAGRSTEYLLLLQRYLKQARELQALAGPEGVIRVSNCSDAQPLLAILGYRLAQACGPNVALQTE